MARGDYERRVTATSRDEVGELARAFNAMAADLADVERMRRDLVANVSHELRTPISALQARAREPRRRRRAADPRRGRDRARADRSGSGRLVEQLLDLSRLESRHAAARAPSASASTSCSTAPRASACSASATVRLRIEVDPIDLEATGDPERLQQVRRQPARQRGPPLAARGARVAGRLQRRPEHHDRGLRRGPGHPARARPSACSSASTAPTHARSARDGGTGLGLAIARWIVDAHGGSIRAEERDPQGCRMVSSCPREPPPFGRPSVGRADAAPPPLRDPRVGARSLRSSLARPARRPRASTAIALARRSPWSPRRHAAARSVAARLLGRRRGARARCRRCAPPAGSSSSSLLAAVGARPRSPRPARAAGARCSRARSAGCAQLVPGLAVVTARRRRLGGREPARRGSARAPAARRSPRCCSRSSCRCS